MAPDSTGHGSPTKHMRRHQSPPPPNSHILTFDAQYMRALTLAKLPPPLPDHLRRQFIAATTAPATLRFQKPVPAPYNREPSSHGGFEDAAAAQAAAVADDDAAPTFDTPPNPSTPSPGRAPPPPPARGGGGGGAAGGGGGGGGGRARAWKGKAGAGVERAAGAAVGYVCRMCLL
jgi:hypothetical protein